MKEDLSLFRVYFVITGVRHPVKQLFLLKMTRHQQHQRQPKQKQHKNQKPQAQSQKAKTLSTHSICGLPVSNVGLNQLKKCIRDSKRSLQKVGPCGCLQSHDIPSRTLLPPRPQADLPADKRQEHERKLQANLAMLEGRTWSEMERTHVLKYKRIRFFERRKAERRLKKARKADQGGASESDQESSDSDDEEQETSGTSPQASNKILHKAQMDLDFVMYFPKLIKYLSLYADSAERCRDEQGSGEVEDHDGDHEEDTLNNDKTIQRRKEIYAAIAQYMDRLRAKGTLATTNSNLHEKVTMHLLRQLPWLAREHWHSLLTQNRTVYESVGKYINAMLEQKLEALAFFEEDDEEEETVEAAGAIHVEDQEQDDFFME